MGAIGVALVLLGCGAAFVAIVGRQKRPAANGLVAYLTDLGEIDQRAEEPAPVEDDLSDLFQPSNRPLARLSRRLAGLYPDSHVEKVRAKMLAAGLSATMSPEEFVTLQVGAALAGTAMSVLIVARGVGHGKLTILLVLLLLFGGLIAPHAWLSGRADRRIKAIEAELPDTLDLLTISVEAGLGLEGAIGSVAEDADTALGTELGRTLQEMNLGLSRQQALENLKHRAPAPDLERFILVLTQADSLGMPIGRVLRSQADEMRSKRRGRAREKAAKLPVKILFPLMLFILPPLMIVVLGPAILTAAKSFSHGGI